MVASEYEQIDNLLNLARDKSVEARTRLVQIVGDLFFDTDIALTDRERALMRDILRQLIHDAEIRVRRMLAHRLAGEPGAPPELVTTLANDEIEVAHPILSESMVLQDVELIEIIEHRTLAHQLAIATRQAISEEVSDALVGTGQVDVIKTLLENHGADISQATMEYLVEQSERVDAYQNPLLRRQELTPELAQRMYWWVSAALREYIVDNFDIDPTAIEEQLQATVEEIVESEEAEAKSKADRLARKLDKSGAISIKLLTDTLRQGEVALFEDLLAELSDLPVRVIQRVIYQPGGQPLAIVCRAVELEKGDFAAIFLLSRGARPGDKVVDPGELPRVMEFYDSVRPEDARRVLRRWRLNPDFQLSLEQVGARRQGGARN